MTKPLKIRMSKQVKLFLQTLPPDEQRVLLDHFERIASGDLTGVEMSPEERAIYESEEGVDLEAMVQDAGDDEEN